MWKVSVLAAAGAFILTTGANAEWLSSDDQAVADLGFTYGMAEHCQLDASSLLTQSALYIGIHTQSNQQAEAAGTLFRRKADEGQ